MRTFKKTPNEVLPYPVDFTDLIGAGTISSVAWTLESGITKDSQSNTTTTATAVISGGTAGTTYDVTCKITATTTGYKYERSFQIAVVSKKYT